MRRYVFLVLFMISAMVGLITWATRPDLVQAQYDRVAAPIAEHFAAKRAAAAQAAKEKAWVDWLAREQLPADCARPATALRSLECRNRIQQAASSFERAWADRAGGFRPEGSD